MKENSSSNSIKDDRDRVPISSYFKKKKSNHENTETTKDNAGNILKPCNETAQKEISDETNATTPNEMLFNFKINEEDAKEEEPSSFSFSFQLDDTKSTKKRRKKRKNKSKVKESKENRNDIGHEEKNKSIKNEIANDEVKCMDVSDNSSTNKELSSNNLVLHEESENGSNNFPNDMNQENPSSKEMNIKTLKSIKNGNPKCNKNSNTSTISIIKPELTACQESNLHQEIHKLKIKEKPKQVTTINIQSTKIKSSSNIPVSKTRITRKKQSQRSKTDKSTVTTTTKKKNKQKNQPEFLLSTSNNGTKAVVNITGMILHKQQKNKNNSSLVSNQEKAQNDNLDSESMQDNRNDSISSPCNAFSFGFDFQF